MLYRRTSCFSEICNSCGLVIKTFVPTAWLITIPINDDDDDGRNITSTAFSFPKAEQKTNDFYIKFYNFT
jgi:hypothetical protein